MKSSKNSLGRMEGRGNIKLNQKWKSPKWPKLPHTYLKCTRNDTLKRHKKCLEKKLNNKNRPFIRTDLACGNIFFLSKQGVCDPNSSGDHSNIFCVQPLHFTVFTPGRSFKPRKLSRYMWWLTRPKRVARFRKWGHGVRDERQESV